MLFQVTQFFTTLFFVLVYICFCLWHRFLKKDLQNRRTYLPILLLIFLVKNVFEVMIWINFKNFAM